MRPQKHRLSFSLEEFDEHNQDEDGSAASEAGRVASSPGPSRDEPEKDDSHQECVSRSKKERRRKRRREREARETQREEKAFSASSSITKNNAPAGASSDAESSQERRKGEGLKFFSMAEMTAAKFACENKAAAQRAREERLFSSLPHSDSGATPSTSFSLDAEGRTSPKLNFNAASPEAFATWGARRGVGELHSDLPSEEALERSGFLVKTNGDSRREAPFEVLFSVCGLKGHRERNEDRYSAVAHFAQNAALFAVFDGHNGSDSASFCSAFLAPLLARQLSEKCPPRAASVHRSAGAPSSTAALSEVGFRCDFSDPRKCRGALRFGEGPGEEGGWTDRGTRGCAWERHGSQPTPQKKESGCQSVRCALHEAFAELNSLYLRKNPMAEDGTTALALLLRWPAKVSRKRRSLDSRASTPERQKGPSCKWKKDLRRADCSSPSEGEVSSDSSDGEEGAELFAAHVGDSRAVMVRRRRRARSDAAVQALRLTEDHKPSRETERQRIVESGGFVVLLGCPRVGFGKTGFFLAMSRSIGDYCLKRAHEQLVPAEPEITHRQLRPSRDVLMLLASDGLWDVMSDQQAAEFVAERFAQRNPKEDARRCPPRFSQAALDEAAKALAEEALKRGSEDNVTVLLVGLNWKSRTRL